MILASTGTNISTIAPTRWMLYTREPSLNSKNSAPTPIESLILTRTSPTKAWTTSSARKSFPRSTTISLSLSHLRMRQISTTLWIHRCTLPTRRFMAFGISRTPLSPLMDSGAYILRSSTRQCTMVWVAKSFSRASGNRFRTLSSKRTRRSITIL